MTTRPPCRNLFRDAHFEIIQFCLFVSSVSSFFVYRFAFSFILSFHFGVTVPAILGRNNTRWPLNLRMRWLYASRLSSCDLSFYSSLFSSFSSLFPSIPLFFFSVSVTVRQRRFRFPFVPVTCRKIIFFSSFPPTFFPLVVVSKTSEILRKMAVTIYRELRADSPTHYREFSGR
jgi:hypothetical protein